MRPKPGDLASKVPVEGYRYHFTAKSRTGPARRSRKSEQAVYLGSFERDPLYAWRVQRVRVASPRGFKVTSMLFILSNHSKPSNQQG
jgi:hypothetical protein